MTGSGRESTVSSVPRVPRLESRLGFPISTVVRKILPVPSSKKDLVDDVRPREVWGWMMFDFANSGYTTVVITAVFNAYFVAVLAGQAGCGPLPRRAGLSSVL